VDKNPILSSSYIAIHYYISHYVSTLSISLHVYPSQTYLFKRVQCVSICIGLHMYSYASLETCKSDIIKC